MLYYKNLEEIIFNRHTHLLDPDEFVVISGYLGPAPMKRLHNLGLKVTVIGGMYSNGINVNLWNSLDKISKEDSKLNLLFSTFDVHSKIYLWKKDNKIISVLIGSANFSRNGLCTEFRETLADASSDTFAPLNEYLNLIITNATGTPRIRDETVSSDFEHKTTDIDKNYKLKFQYEIPLYDEAKKIVLPKSGLNWGLSDAHVADGDAYIRIPKEVLKKSPGLIPPYDDTYISQTVGRRRNSDPIEIIWDDGITMEASLEGNQVLDGLTYPKQIASYHQGVVYENGERISVKSILGRYLRKRLGVKLKELITYETLEKYGRTTITLSLIEDGIYFADFSVGNKEMTK